MAHAIEYLVDMSNLLMKRLYDAIAFLALGFALLVVQGLAIKAFLCYLPVIYLSRNPGSVAINTRIVMFDVPAPFALGVTLLGFCAGAVANIAVLCYLLVICRIIKGDEGMNIEGIENVLRSMQANAATIEAAQDAFFTIAAVLVCLCSIYIVDTLRDACCDVVLEACYCQAYD